MVIPNARWETVKRIHQVVLDHTPTDRATVLTDLCGGDEPLRREVESLLAYETSADAFLDTPAIDVAAKTLAGAGETLVGRMLAHYRVEGLLGAGGMGEVYLARDPRLDRVVALKILPADLAIAPERMERFTREAKAASALNHPNVAMVHDVGDSEGVRFIVMEYVDGQTLAEKIAEHALSVADVVDVAIQVADALDAAHSKGIVHRDIKPANLMLTPRGQVKMLDFGIAKTAQPEPAAGEAAAGVQTAAGAMIGSLSHMSPEQVLGTDVDGRSDLFSLGVAMYEMATGRLPFTGATRVELLDRICHGAPESIRSSHAGVPMELERIVFRCLEKRPGQRYNSARALFDDLCELKRALEVATGVTRPPRTAADRRPSDRPLEAYELIGRGRHHLLSGSFFELPKAVAAFRAAAELDPAYAAAHAGLALALVGQAVHRAVPHQQAFADARVAALRALVIDSESADAHVALGGVLFLGDWDWPEAERSFERALAINPNHPEAFLHYGGLMEALGRLDRGLWLKQQALERDPASALAHVLIAVSFWNRRRYDDTIAWADRALERDPRHLFAHQLRGGAYFKKGDVARAVEADLAFAESVGAPEERRAAWRRVGADMMDAYAAGGHRAVVRCILKHVRDESGAGAAGLRLPILYADAGDLDTAFAHLDRAIDVRDPGLVHLAVAPQWDSLRSDPRFRDRLVRMRLPTDCAGAV
jgi:eukaryotic-like serine/threonine-protein kinase